MKDKLLFGTIGLLVGIVVMQWTMPAGQAQVVGAPAGNVAALIGGANILATDSGIWQFEWDSGTWYKFGENLPIPFTDVRFIDSNESFVDKDGNFWEHATSDHWVNHGPPSIAPLASEQSTWSKVKAKFSGKEAKQ